MSTTTQDLLERSRKELLDLSTRNRLLSIPVHYRSARVIHVHDELSEQVYRLLVTDKKTLSFLPGRPSRTHGGPQPADKPEEPDFSNHEVALPQPDDQEDAATGLAKRHIDARLQTSLSPEGLQRRLLDLHRDAATMEEEQGVNILYLAMGHLKWLETERADTPRFAPLLLVPVSLQRRSASEKFVLRWREEDVEENLSLRAKLLADFGIELPDFPEEDELSPAPYFQAIAEAVHGATGWEVLPDAITLGFFSFAKFLMYRDLDPETWPESASLLEHPLITGLLQDGFPQGAPLLSEDADLDEQIPVSRLDHVVDADSSQTRSIETVRQGRNLVIQGPPGTGKSQSITNLIATAVLDGKKVLFVAEKLAALQVVKRRLEREGLGDLCLELHSNKSNKRAVIEEIGRTWRLGRPKASVLEDLVAKLENRRALLNHHVASLHSAHSPSGLTPFAIIGQLAILRDGGRSSVQLAFPGAESWKPEDHEERRGLMEELVGRIEQLGIPNRHPWRGVCRDVVLNVDLDSIQASIGALQSALGDLGRTAANVAEILNQPLPTTLAELEEQRIVSGYVASAPQVDRAAICNSVWNAGLDGLRDLVEAGRKYAAALAEVGNQTTESVWEKDFSEARSHVAAHGRSWLRFLNGKFRRAIAQLRGELSAELPGDHQERLALVDKIVAGQRALKAVRSGSALGQSAFGVGWCDEKTDWDQAAEVLQWVTSHSESGLGASFRQTFAAVNDQTRLVEPLDRFSRQLVDANKILSELFERLSLDCNLAFDCDAPAGISLDVLTERCSLWLSQMEGLSRWTNYFVRAKRAREQGLAALVDEIERGEVAAGSAVDAFDRVYYTQILREVMRQHPDLAQFDGMLHNTRIAEFRQLDRERLALAKFRTLHAHHTAMPPFNASVGAAGIVRAEMERKRGHRPVRRLLKDAGSVVQTIKPVFMMSPLSVAQFLAPSAIAFDLLVIDEASQVEPVDALGAIARCEQIVVVGDSRQLPPTRFFTRLTSNSEDAEEADEDAPLAAEARDMESILGLCGARGLPQSMLRWHYRSRHHSLIAVSNHEFYEDRLFLIPSPLIRVAGLGLKFIHLPDATFDSGASGTNRVEAQAIGRAIIEHARSSPSLSLGVAAFSVRQQQAILDELELLRREHPDTEPFFYENPAEPFFVKNLENVQGDERDVIFISVGYGRNPQGYMAMRFGPLSNEGGERRLNVLISRAKRQCVVFSSITADDIDLERASGRGVAAFKTFLTFAQTGRLGIANRTADQEQSPFEEAVRRSVESLGYQVHTQVGIAGFFVDLAVLHPDEPGRYLLGIECDGAPYHSSRSARERDRLRQAVLEDHGWIIHRIWSTDWFQRPQEQLKRVEIELENAKTELQSPGVEDPAAVASTPHDTSDPEIERDEPLLESDDGLAHLAIPYSEASVRIPRRRDIHELPTDKLTDVVLEVVRQEGPIHEVEVVTRLRQLWGLGRAGSRIQDAVGEAIGVAVASGRCVQEGCFLALPDVPVVVRSRTNASSRNLLKAEFLPPAEVRAAIPLVLQEHHGAARDEIASAVARVFGFKRMSTQLKSIVEDQVHGLLEQGTITESSGMLRLSEKAADG